MGAADPVATPVPGDIKYDEHSLGLAVPDTNPVSVEKTQKRFMTSTWYHDAKNTTMPKSFLENPLPYVAQVLRYKGPNPNPSNKGKKIPIISMWTQNMFVLPRAFIPIALQVFSMRYLNLHWPLPVAMVIYTLTFVLFAINMLGHMNAISEKWGFLDEDVARDGVPDVRLNWTIIGLILTVTVRPVMGSFIAYDKFEYPSFSWLTPVHLFIFICVLDFYFYWYHRMMHEVDWLWKFHKTHHMAKHPNALLSAFGDTEQDFFDIFVIPFLTFTTYPVDFHTWWLATVYILYIEAAGHTGARVYWTPPITGPVLRWFDAELVLEDHDLHHRQGWRKSSNYGKQTRLWDKVFGSTRARIETTPETIDFGFMGLGYFFPIFSDRGI